MWYENNEDEFKNIFFYRLKIGIQKETRTTQHCYWRIECHLNGLNTY